MEPWIARGLVRLVTLVSLLALSFMAGLGTAYASPAPLAESPTALTHSLGKAITAAERDAALRPAGPGAETLRTAAAGSSSRVSLFLKPAHGYTVEGLDLGRLGFRVKRSLPQLGFTVIDGPRERAGQALATLETDPRVSWVHRDVPFRLQHAPNDEVFAEQWDVKRVGLPEGWDMTTGRADIVVAILDTGLLREVPDFQGRVVSAYSVPHDSSEYPAWADLHGHGTAVASMAAAAGDNELGVAGAAWGVSIMPVHLSDGEEIPLENMILGIVWAVEHGADVINISAGADFEVVAAELALRWAVENGVTVVAAAGNSGPKGQVAFPAGWQGVIAVGAINKQDQVAQFSSIGAALDIMAPGEEVLAWTRDATHYGIERMNGTSFAAPMVSGVVALMLSLDPSLKPAEIEILLANSAEDLGRPGWDSRFGEGLLNVPAALDKVARREPAAPQVYFRDVPVGHPYAQAVMALAKAGIVQGYGDGTFGPDRKVTREEFAKMVLLTLDQMPTEDLTEPFQDVEDVPGLFPDDYIALAYQLGITKGVSENPPRFGPKSLVMRAQVTTMTVRGADAVKPGFLVLPPAGSVPPYGSFSPAHDPAAAKAFHNRLMDRLVAVGPSYDPWRNASRGEVAGMLAPLVGIQ